MKWVRDCECAICQGPVIYDDADTSIDCACGKYKLNTPLSAFHLVLRFSPVHEAGSKSNTVEVVKK